MFLKAKPFEKQNALAGGPRDSPAVRVPVDNARPLQSHGGKNAKTGEMSPASSLLQFRNISIKEL